MNRAERRAIKYGKPFTSNRVFHEPNPNLLSVQRDIEDGCNESFDFERFELWEDIVDEHPSEFLPYPWFL